MRLQLQGSDVQFIFGDHMLDDDRRELRRGAEPIAIEPRYSTYSFTWRKTVIASSAKREGRPDRFRFDSEQLHQCMQPNISRAWIANQKSFQHDADQKHYLERFPRAGLE